jgi:hypothetical protein
MTLASSAPVLASLAASVPILETLVSCAPALTDASRFFAGEYSRAPQTSSIVPSTPFSSSARLGASMLVPHGLVPPSSPTVPSNDHAQADSDDELIDELEAEEDVWDDEELDGADAVHFGL